MRVDIKLLVCLLNVVAALSLAERSPAQSQPPRPSYARPNIIFILTDDQRWSALGYAGNPLTPIARAAGAHLVPTS